MTVAVSELLYKRKYSPEQRKKLAGEGKAMPDGSYPIVTVQDLENAKHAFGRGGGASSKLRAYINRRAAALKQPKMGEVKKVETFSKPGTADVTPDDLKHLRPLLEHYRKQPKPFTACYHDQVKHGLSPDHAKRRCAVIKDLIEGGTDWRGKSKVVPSSGEWTDEAVSEIDVIAEKLGFNKQGKKKKPTGVVARLMSRKAKHPGENC